MNIVQQIEKERMTRKVPDFKPGDTVIVQVKVVEGDRERVQASEGVVIAISNRGLNSSFTVRKISHGEGVERVFQTYSPSISEITVKRRGNVRRAKLYYLRDLSGKAARIEEKLCPPAAASSELSRSRRSHQKSRLLVAASLLMSENGPQAAFSTRQFHELPAFDSVRAVAWPGCAAQVPAPRRAVGYLWLCRWCPSRLRSDGASEGGASRGAGGANRRAGERRPSRARSATGAWPGSL